jgi:hypothetical protein
MSSSAVINYNDLEAAKKQELQTQIHRRLRDKVQYGEREGLRQIILRLVVDGHYERANEELEEFVLSKTQYPRFEPRAAPFKNHCKDLIFAIESKRHFPGLSQLSSSKHQELFDKVVEHFEELKNVLIKIEIVEKEEKVKDLKSTLILVRAFWTCLFTIISFAFMLAFVNDGIAFSMNVVFDDVLSKTLEKVFELF